MPLHDMYMLPDPSLDFNSYGISKCTHRYPDCPSLQVIPAHDVHSNSRSLVPHSCRPRVREAAQEEAGVSCSLLWRSSQLPVLGIAAVAVVAAEQSLEVVLVVVLGLSPLHRHRHRHQSPAHPQALATFLCSRPLIRSVEVVGEVYMLGIVAWERP